MANLTAPLRTLLDHARAEAKRAGHPRTEAIHLAAAFLKTEPQRFVAALGAGAGDALTTKLRELPKGTAASSDSPELLSLLDLAATAADANTFLLDKLRMMYFAVGSAPAASPGAAPVLTAAANEKLTSNFAIADRSNRFVTVVVPDANVVARADTVEKLLGLLGRRKPATPCVLAPRGGGKSALLVALATRLQAMNTGAPLAGLTVVRIKAEAVVAAERARTLRQILEDIGNRAMIVLDDIEVLAALGGNAADLDMLGVIRSLVGHGETRAILAMATPYFAKLEMHDGELASTLTRIELPALDDVTLRRIGAQRVAALAQFHRVEIPAAVLDAALAPAPPDSKRMHPGLLIDRLDYAGACAALRADRRANVADLGTTATLKKRALNADALMKTLEQRVTGQPHAIERVARRLSLTSANLDLRPGRPDGVFLFVGPTGTGKTELARAMAEAVFGDADTIITLDMSEYAQEWALSRLIGPQPGYVGYTEPEGWLTTKVRGRPYSLVLLDEFEKAHPRVWTAFLQVFDAGRLTDARGNTADFSDCIVVLTSNIGSRSFSSTPMGFVSDKQAKVTTESARVIDAVRNTMAPELVNRIDDIIVFQPLGPEVIHRIAEQQIAHAFERLRAKGYELSMTPEVLRLIAEGGYDPAFGARHVQRNIERTLLQTLVEWAPGRLRAEVRDSAVVWVTAT